MEKNLLTITYNVETEDRVIRECNYAETLDWSKDEYDAEILNCLAVALGSKVKTMFQSDKVQQQALNMIIHTIQTCM